MSLSTHAVVHEVTDRIRRRSRATRASYLRRIEAQRERGPLRGRLSCTNLAHGFAACGAAEKDALKGDVAPNIGIVTAYNDMLSAHQPMAAYPERIKAAARRVGAVAQVAGGVPAMCDGVTQGRGGMDLSLFSRDVIAQATAVALSHDMFDAAICIGTCDKIVPGLLIGALAFGHLPVIFLPAGPMPSGLSNSEKSRIRQLYTEGRIGRDELLEAEARSYHSPGTCTFYGTANSNQMLMEVMGLHLPGESFVNPGDPLRDAFIDAVTERVAALTALGADYQPLAGVVDERSLVNGVVGLLSTGGSTNHTMHLVAIARAAGLILDWDDFAALSRVVPTLTRLYPNGSADVNQFQAAGGMPLLIRELLAAGLLHEDIATVAGPGLTRYTESPQLDGDTVRWGAGPRGSADTEVLRAAAEPFSPTGGLALVQGPLGRAVCKVSAVRPEHRVVQAPALIFHEQDDLLDAFRRGELDGRDFIAVVRFQGPRARGMPELHKLTPTLGVLQDRGQRVALVTDGRMSGASGKVPAAIHLWPEALEGGALARLRDGDPLRLDCDAGTLEVDVDAGEFAARPAAGCDLSAVREQLGRELFGGFRQLVGHAEAGACTLFAGWDEVPQPQGAVVTV